MCVTILAFLFLGRTKLPPRAGRPLLADPAMPPADARTRNPGRETILTVAPIDVLWKDAPDDHDYPAASQYLSLLADPGTVKRLVKNLRKAPPSHQKAKDILRAAALPLLGRDNPHVAADLARIAAGVALSPILLVRGELAAGRPLQIADGYHRVCATYHTAENTDIPCRVAAAETTG